MSKENRTQTLKKCFGEIYKQGKMLDDARAKHYNLTGTQLRYIEIIGDNPGISQDAVARLTGVDKGTVARAVKKLEVEQYIYRKRNKDDIRAWCLYLDRRGNEVYSSKACKSEDYEKNLFSGFKEDEIDTLVNLMDRLTDNIETIKKKG